MQSLSLQKLSGIQVDAIVIGASKGGLSLLKEILSQLPSEYNIPIMVVQHVLPTQGNSAANLLDNYSKIRIKDAEDKEEIKPGTAYFAPPNYHLLVEEEKRIALNSDEKVNWSRPSIDLLFQSAVFAWAPHLLGIILSGANHDGAMGIRTLHQNGCLTIAQNPMEAESPEMPEAAIKTGCIDSVLDIKEIAFLLRQIGGGK